MFPIKRLQNQKNVYWVVLKLFNSMELVIWLQILWKLVGNGLEFSGKFVGNLCNTSFCPQGSWLTHLRSCPPAQPMHPDD